MRVAPLPAAEWDDAVLRALRMMPEEHRNPTTAGNAVATFVNHPDLTRSYLCLLYISPSPRDRS